MKMMDPQKPHDSDNWMHDMQWQIWFWKTSLDRNQMVMNEINDKY